MQDRTTQPSDVGDENVLVTDRSSVSTLGSLMVENGSRPPDDYVQALTSEPVLDGYDHPAQEVLARNLARDADRTLGWVEAILLRGDKPAWAADTLRLICRLGVLSADQRAALVQLELQSNFLEVRDAAMQAVETWGASPLLDVLKRHSDTDKFLSDYAARIVGDLEAL